MIIDKNAFTAEELAQFDALIAKAKVDPEANQEAMKECAPSGKKPAKKAGPNIDPKIDNEMEEEDDMEDEMEKGKCKNGGCKKSAPETSPEIQKALEEMQALKKSFEMKEMTEVAKKYAPLGKKEEELAQTLYDMKKSNEANYNAYIAILDESLGIVEKSGIFSEIGKSAGNASTSGGAVAKAEAKADAIMKADPTMSYTDAIAKAWEDPALMAEYDAEYNG